MAYLQFLESIRANLDWSYHDNALLSAIQKRPDTGTSTISVTEINIRNRANSTAFAVVNRLPTLAPATADSLTLAQSTNSLDQSSVCT